MGMRDWREYQHQLNNVVKRGKTTNYLSKCQVINNCCPSWIREAIPEKRIGGNLEPNDMFALMVRRFDVVAAISREAFTSDPVRYTSLLE